MFCRLIALALVVTSPIVGQAQVSPLKSPEISANALFLYRNSNFHQEDLDETRNGLDVQETEIMFASAVDPYSRLSVLLAVHPEYDSSSGTLVQTWAVEPEELFAESDHVAGVTLKLGKFKAAFGKHNPLHSHAFPFVDAPLANSQLLGAEGLNDAGVSAAGLLPLPWFSELTAQYLRGAGENDEFNSPTPGDAIGVARWRNLLDLSDALTLEVGASFARGNNSVGGHTTLGSGDLTFKWRPTSGGKYQSALLAVECIGRDLQQTGFADERGRGLSLWGKYQFAERWSAQTRYETLEVRGSLNPSLPNLLTSKNSFAVVFAATEFSLFKAEYDQARGPINAKGSNVERTFYLQANFTIGAHAAHSY